MLQFSSKLRFSLLLYKQNAFTLPVVTREPTAGRTDRRQKEVGDGRRPPKEVTRKELVSKGKEEVAGGKSRQQQSNKKTQARESKQRMADSTKQAAGGPTVST